MVFIIMPRESKYQIETNGQRLVDPILMLKQRTNNFKSLCKKTNYVFDILTQGKVKCLSLSLV